MSVRFRVRVAVPLLFGMLPFAACRDQSAPLAPEFEVRAARVKDPLLVTNVNDDGPGSLRAALAAAPAATTVTIAPSLAGQVIVLASPLQVTRAVSVEGPASAPVTIDGAGQHRVLVVNQSTEETTRWSSVNFRNGSAMNAPALERDGGNIVVHSGSLALIRSTVEGGLADRGGGIAVRTSGRVSLDQVIVARNQATSTGGGVYALGPGVSALTVMVRQNRAAVGGGMMLNGGTLTRVTFYDNSATVEGGGLVANDLSGTNLTLTGNAAPLGAAVIGDADSRISFATIAGNAGTTHVAGNGLTFRYSIVSGVGTLCETISSITFETTNLVTDFTCGGGASAVFANIGFIGMEMSPDGLGAWFTLSAASAAIDAGGACGQPFDIRRSARPQGLGCDLGSYETSPASTETIDVPSSGVLESGTGHLTVSAGGTCRGEGWLPLTVRVDQPQRVGKLAFVQTATRFVAAQCTGGSYSWTAYVAPVTGGFVGGSATVTVSTSQGVYGPQSATAVARLTWAK